MNGLVIRRMAAQDATAIHALLVRAFDGEVEAQLVADLAQDGDLFLSLVAEADSVIVGHLAYSPLRLEGSDARGQALAPLAVAPEWQRRGIGTALVANAHEILRQEQQDFVLVLGDPAYYGRFGFSIEAAQRFTTPYDGPYLQALAMSEYGDTASGRISYAPAFARLGEAG